ncbi:MULTISPECIES: divalent-cation tolerance protein CutA [Hyphobacterium]|uniref:Divalent-cation tolerance protein CutA n=1 Tax=Hyphobacterium vulgare TaxID=1736751 RepID=A0ABV6ZZP7_9PROT
MSEAALIYSTWPDGDTAAKAASALLDEKLIACANIFPAGRSIYVWDGAVKDEAETVMMVKTTAGCAARVRDRLLTLHPYDTPCVLGIDLKRTQSSSAFTHWIRETIAR